MRGYDLAMRELARHMDVSDSSVLLLSVCVLLSDSLDFYWFHRSLSMGQSFLKGLYVVRSS
jgi:hypothetical protein